MPNLATSAYVALHRGHDGAALDHLAVDPDDWQTWWHSALMMYRAWYAAVRVAAAVLAQHDDAPDRIERGRRVVRDNPIASAMVERAAAFAADNRPPSRTWRQHSKPSFAPASTSAPAFSLP